MSTVGCNGCQYVGPEGPRGPRGNQGPRGEPGIELPLKFDLGYRGLVTANDRDEFQLMTWDDVIAQLLIELGLQPGDRLLIKRCDGSVAELPLEVLNERCAEEIHAT